MLTTKIKLFIAIINKGKSATLSCRRDQIPQLYSAGNVHLLPGYPENKPSLLLVAFYVQQPLGINADSAVIPVNTLLEIVDASQTALENAVGANISNITPLVEPVTPSPTSPVTAEESSFDWRWIVIGVLAALILLLLVLLLYFCW